MEKRRLFIFIIESPSAEDFRMGILEGRFLEEGAKLASIESVHKIAVNKKSFESILYKDLLNEIKKHISYKRLLWPVIHISAHGNNEGIALTNEDFIRWKDLHELFIPINQKLDGKLILCFSTCQGYSATQMAMNPNEFSCYGFVGNGGTPTWSETAIGFAVFYHHLARGAQINDAVNAMKIASGNDKFITQSSEQSREGYINFLESKNAYEALSEFVQKPPQPRYR